MGLSNQERIMRVVWSIHRLREQIPVIRKYESQGRYSPTGLSDLLEQMWVALLAKQGNSLFWIFGSKMLNQDIDPDNLWSIAMYEHGESVTRSVRKTLEEMEDRIQNEPRTNQDDSDYGRAGYVNIDSIICGANNGEFCSAVIKVYHEIENCQYALNRYDDELAKGFDNLRALCAQIHGRCFSIISSETVFFEAYLLQMIYDAVTAGMWDSTTNIGFALVKRFNLHHAWKVSNRSNLELAKLMRIWKDLREKTPSNEEKVSIILTIAGHCFGEYKHERTSLAVFLRKFNTGKTSKKRVRFSKLTPIIKRLCEAYKARKKEETEGYKNERYCWLMDNFELDDLDIRQVEEFRRKQAEEGRAKYDPEKYKRELAQMKRKAQNKRAKALK